MALERRWISGEGWQTVEVADPGSFRAQIIGPYVVNFDTPGLLGDPGAELFSLNADDWLIDAWVQVDGEFDVADPLFIVGRGSPNDSFFLWNGMDVSSGQETLGEVLEYAQSVASGQTLKGTFARSDDDRRRDLPARVAADCTINAVMYPSGPNPGSGSVRIWALVAGSS